MSMSVSMSVGNTLTWQMEYQRKVLGEAKFPVYILQAANDKGQVSSSSLSQAWPLT